MVVYSYSTQCVATLDDVILARSCLGGYLLVLLFGLNLHLEILRKARIWAELGTLQEECFASQSAGWEVYKTLGVKRLTLVSHLEVEVWTGAATCIAAIADNLTCRNPLLCLDEYL